MLPFVLWNASTNLASYWKVRRLVAQPAFAETVRNNPRFAFKFLTHHYLVRRLPVSSRAACFLHHYRRLQAIFPDFVLRQSLSGELPLLHIAESGHSFAITMGLSVPHDKEGEYSLNLYVDGAIVFLFSFNFIPGWVVGSPQQEAILITRVQGFKGRFDRIALATRTLHDVAPDQLLLASMQGIAAALGISTLAGVTGARQTCYLDEFSDLFHKTYDVFFEEMGFSLTGEGFYLGNLPLQQKPLADIKRGHKIRTKEKRAFKQEIASLSATRFLSMCTPGTGSATLDPTANQLAAQPAPSSQLPPS